MFFLPAFKEPLINSALRLHASALSSHCRQILGITRYAFGLSPSEIQRIHANPEYFISSVVPKTFVRKQDFSLQGRNKDKEVLVW